MMKFKNKEDNKGKTIIHRERSVYIMREDTRKDT